MSNDIVENKSFEEKLKDKIRESIGELISNDDLEKIILKGIQETFFDKRRNPKKFSGYHSNNEPEYIEPFITEVMKQVLTPVVSTHINAYLKEHNEEVLRVVKDVVTQGVGAAVINAMNQQFQSQLFQFQTNIENKLMSR